MASLKITRASRFHLLLFLVLLLTLSPSFHRHPHLVAADYQLIQTTCHEAEGWETCLQCVNSDPNAKNANQLGLVAILMNCIGNHSDELAADMLGIAEKASDQIEKTEFYQCYRGYLPVRQVLLEGITKLKNGNLQEAEKSIDNAVFENYKCQAITQSYKGEISSGPVANTMKIYEQLCQAGTTILKKFN